MQYTEILNGEVYKIKISEKFTFSDHLEFKKILESFDGNAFKNMEIDVSGLEFIDSAALGLLLLLRERTAQSQVKLSLIKPQGQVQKMFRISRFYELFNIVE